MRHMEYMQRNHIQNSNLNPVAVACALVDPFPQVEQPSTLPCAAGPWESPTSHHRDAAGVVYHTSLRRPFNPTTVVADVLCKMCWLP